MHNDQQVRFKYKDYREQGKIKVMSLNAMEFIRRFSMHILHKEFMRIRHFGILSNTRRQKTMPLDSEYKYALVAGATLKYLWILSEETSIPDQVKDKYLKIGEEVGYKTSDFIWVEHNQHK